MHQVFLDILTGFRTFKISTWAKSLIAYVPDYQWNFRWLFIALLVIFLLGGLALVFMRRMHPPLRQRWLNFFWGNLAIGIIIFFFRDQRIPYLGMDILRFLYEIGILVWLNSIVWYCRTGYKKEMAEKVAIERKSKYLPKPKR